MKNKEISLQDKIRALRLAYHIITDKRNENRYGGTAIVRKDAPDMFTYSDMLSAIKAIFDELGDGPEKPAMQKPLTLRELLVMIDAREEAVTYCEAKDDPQIYANIWYDGRAIDRNAEAVHCRQLIYAHYGRTWRAWASRPTDEERAAAPWEKDHE